MKKFLIGILLLIILYGIYWCYLNVPLPFLTCKTTGGANKLEMGFIDGKLQRVYTNPTISTYHCSLNQFLFHRNLNAA